MVAVLLVEVPGRDTYRIEHLVLDVNGTIALDGSPLPGVADAVRELSQVMRVWAITADTHGTAEGLAAQIGVELKIIAAGEESAQKSAFVEDLGAQAVVAIGNGANDELMLEAAAIGVAVLGPEGLAKQAIEAADVVVASIDDALGLLLEPRRLIATLRR